MQLLPHTKPSPPCGHVSRPIPCPPSLLVDYPCLQVRKLSVQRITSPLTYDNLDNIVPGGLYDPALGPVDQNARWGWLATAAPCGTGQATAVLHARCRSLLQHVEGSGQRCVCHALVSHLRSSGCTNVHKQVTA
jgi:hypothetical protein